MGFGLTYHQQLGHMETKPRLKVSPERPQKRWISRGLVIRRVFYYTIAALEYYDVL